MKRRNKRRALKAIERIIDLMISNCLVLSALLFAVAHTVSQVPVVPPALATTNPQDRPLPAIADLLCDVERNEDAFERMRREYTYHIHQESQDFDGKGEVKKTTTIDAESLTIDGVRVNREVARNGKPLTPEDAKKESDKIDKEVAKDKERRAKLEREGKPTNSRGEDELTVSRILQLGTFSNPRRVEMNGRPTIVADYAGDPNAKTNSRFETMFRDLVGTVWIDEQDRALVQVQGHFLKDFKIGGGLLADVKKDSNFSGRFTKVNDEAWLPAEFSGQGKIRVLLFGGFNGNIRLVATDYKKFRASVTILPSNRVIGDDGKPVEEPKP